MAKITLQGNPIETIGDLPGVNTQAPEFNLTKTELSDCKPSDFTGQTVGMNISPITGTSVWADSVRRFNIGASNSGNTVLPYVSADLTLPSPRKNTFRRFPVNG